MNGPAFKAATMVTDAGDQAMEGDHPVEITTKRLAEIEEGRGEPANLAEIEAIARVLGLPAWLLVQIAEVGGPEEWAKTMKRARQN